MPHLRHLKKIKIQNTTCIACRCNNYTERLFKRIQREQKTCSMIMRKWRTSVLCAAHRSFLHRNVCIPLKMHNAVFCFFANGRRSNPARINLHRWSWAEPDKSNKKREKCHWPQSCFECSRPPWWWHHNVCYSLAEWSRPLLWKHLMTLTTYSHF